MEKKAPQKTPLYQMIYTELKGDIESSKYVAGDVLPSERELMALFEVERITVRRALDMLVQDGLVEKIAGVGTKVRDFSLQYDKKESKNILFFLPTRKDEINMFTRPFNAIVFNSVQNECKKHGYSLIVSSLDQNDDLLSIVKKNEAAGIVFLSNIQEEFLSEALQMKIPSVLVNNYHMGFVSVVIDSENGARLISEHLLELGHRRIAFIGGLSGYITQDERQRGYENTLKQAGIAWDDSIVAYGDWTSDGGYAAMRKILKRGSDFTAVFAANDMMAFGAIRAIREAGLSVPDDISVAGFDDIENDMYISEKLTTIRVNIKSIGSITCQMLFNNIATNQMPDIKIVCPVDLIVRESAKRMAPAES